ncbi:MAG: hypothetical protein A3J75_00535 [Acidobacteria bacterium RBG_16_68_9]|nr:MAG: hypothetical protein A3J75_00535 [Acidobacteria bacterium RBG_16_68_9]
MKSEQQRPGAAVERRDETGPVRQGPAGLAQASVLVVGAGALGCPAAWQLAAAGIGTLVILDPDVVELSNLHRQVLHRTSTLGAPKVESVAARLRERHPHTRVEAHAERLTDQNLAHFFRAADFVIDATDSVAAKFLINDGAVRFGRPYSHAGVLGFLGQAMTVSPRRTACYRCLFPEPPPTDAIATCQEAGVIGALAGVIGSVQAAEAIKYLSGGAWLADRLLTFDARSRRWRTVALARNPRCPVCSEQPSTAAPLRDSTEATRIHP